MHPYTIEATTSHRHTAHHFTLKVILIVSALIGIAETNLGHAAVTRLPKVPFNATIADAHCQKFNYQSPTFSRISILNPAAPTLYVSGFPSFYGKNTLNGNYRYSHSRYYHSCLETICSGAVCTTGIGNTFSWAIKDYFQPVCPQNAWLVTPQEDWGDAWVSSGQFNGLHQPTTPDTPWFVKAQCECQDNYVLDQAGTACVQCLPPNFIDPANGRCVTEIYTLSLTPQSVTIEPSKSTTFIATVTKNFSATDFNEVPSKPIPVTVDVKVEATSGGHDHGDATRPKGTLSTTGGNTSFPITFTAEESSGTHTITATCELCVNKTVDAVVTVKVEGLEQIPDSIIKYAQFDSNGAIGAVLHKHESNHYLTADSILKLNKLAKVYAEVNPGFRLFLNDASLEWGGLFDVGTTLWKKPHKTHRRGTSLDIRAASAAGRKGEVPASIFLDFINKADDRNLKVGLHCLNSSDTDYCLGQPNNRHFHVDF